MGAVRYVLVALKAGVDPAEYERFWRGVDYRATIALGSVLSYRIDRITEAPRGIEGGPWDYLERFEVTDRAAFQSEATAAGKGLVEELYGRFLDRSKTVAWWSEPIAP